MYQNDKDKLTDIVLGEAILALLKGDAPVSNTSLIVQLQQMAAVEKDLARQRACLLAVDEVKNNRTVSQQRMSQQLREHDNVTYLFTSEGPPEGTKKH